MSRKCPADSTKTLFFLLCLHSRVCFMGRINADNHLLIILLCFSQMGSQQQPRAMEQNGTHSTVQSMNSYGVFTQTYSKESPHFLKFCKQTSKAYFLVGKYMLLLVFVTLIILTVCVCVCLSSCLLSTWTTPN